MAFNEFRKSMRILFGYYDVHDFSNLEKGTRDEALQQLLTIRQSPRINSKWTMELQQLSKILFQSKDDHARFFGSQIKLISSGPEILRSNVYEDCNLLKSIDEPFKNNYSQGLTSNDYPSGDAVYALYQNSQAYHHLLMSMEKDVGTVNFNEAIHALKTTGIEIERNHCPLKNMYGLFSKYSNRPVKDSPEVTFAINYLYKIGIDGLYNKAMSKEEQNAMLHKYGRTMHEIGSCLEIGDKYKEYELLFSLFQYMEKTWGYSAERQT